LTTALARQLWRHAPTGKVRTMILLRPVLSSATAMALVQSAVAHAQTLGIGIAVAVVDAGGAVQAMWRMDDVAPVVADFALDKAMTARMLKSATAALGERMEVSASFRHGMASRPRMLAWGGGLPILHEGLVIGGIGVSGAKDTDDIACAEAALRAAGLV